MFRQDSKFQYLFGVKEPEFYGAIETDTKKAILFIPKYVITQSYSLLGSLPILPCGWDPFCLLATTRISTRWTKSVSLTRSTPTSANSLPKLCT